MISNIKNKKKNSRLHFESQTKNKPLKCKRSQQETVGFVIIVLMVMIIGVIFLGIWIRASKSGGVAVESAELSNFLSASMSYTTECYKDSAVDYKKISEMIKFCDTNQAITCPNGTTTACSYLSSTYDSMLKRLRPAGILAYYKLSIYFEPEKVEAGESEVEDTTTPTKSRNIVEVKSGNSADCGVRRAGKSPIDAEGGNYIVKLETCEKKVDLS